MSFTELNGIMTGPDVFGGPITTPLMDKVDAAAGKVKDTIYANRGYIKGAVLGVVGALTLAQSREVLASGPANAWGSETFWSDLSKEMVVDVVVASAFGSLWALANKFAADGRLSEAENVLAQYKGFASQAPEVINAWKQMEAFIKSNNGPDAEAAEKEAQKAFLAFAQGKVPPQQIAEEYRGALELYQAVPTYTQQMNEAKNLPRVAAYSIKEGIQMFMVAGGAVAALNLAGKFLPTTMAEETVVSWTDVESTGIWLRAVMAFGLGVWGIKEAVDSRFSPGKYVIKGLERWQRNRDANQAKRAKTLGYNR